MKVIFLKAGIYSIDSTKQVDVSKEDVSSAKEFDIKNADYIEGYVDSGIMLLPCMLKVMGSEYINKTPKPAVKKPGRKAKARV